MDDGTRSGLEVGSSDLPNAPGLRVLLTLCEGDKVRRHAVVVQGVANEADAIMRAKAALLDWVIATARVAERRRADGRG